jgi:valyl-tRNA synthetase
VDEALEAYRFDEAGRAVHRFLWSEYCDWALEMEKPRLYEGDEAERAAASSVLAWVLERTLRLLHPVMPFVTEEIWQRFRAGDSIVTADWPEPHPEHRDAEADEAFGAWTEAMEGARSSLPAIEQGVAFRIEMDPRHRWLVEQQADLAGTLTRTRVRLLEDRGLAVQFERDPERASAHGEDPEAFRRRQEKRLAEVRKRRRREESKLANQAFVSNAAPDAVEKARRKLAELQGEERRLAEQISVLDQAD